MLTSHRHEGPSVRTATALSLCVLCYLAESAAVYGSPPSPPSRAPLTAGADPQWFNGRPQQIQRDPLILDEHVSRFQNIPNPYAYNAALAFLRPSYQVVSPSVRANSLRPKLRQVSVPKSSLSMIPIRSMSMNRLINRPEMETITDPHLDDLNYEYSNYGDDSIFPTNDSEDTIYSDTSEDNDGTQLYDTTTDRSDREKPKRFNQKYFPSSKEVGNTSLEDIRLLKAIVRLLPTTRYGGSAKFLSGMLQSRDVDWNQAETRGPRVAQLPTQAHLFQRYLTPADIASLQSQQQTQQLLQQQHQQQQQQEHQQLHQQLQQQRTLEGGSADESPVNTPPPSIVALGQLKPQPMARESEVEDPLEQLEEPDEKRGLYNRLAGVRGWWAATKKYRRHRPKVNRRAPESKHYTCLKECIMGGQLHPIQCHTLC